MDLEKHRISKYDFKYKLSCSVVSNSLWHHGLFCQPASTRFCYLWDFPSKNTGVGCHFPPCGIFPTQGSNRCLLHHLHCRHILLPSEPPGKPKVLAMKTIQIGKKPTKSLNFAPDFTFLAGITLFTVATSIQVRKQTLLLFPLTIAKKCLPLPKGIWMTMIKQKWTTEDSRNSKNRPDNRSEVLILT